MEIWLKNFEFKFIFLCSELFWAEALREICIFFFMKYLGIIMVNFLQNQVNLLNFTTETHKKENSFACFPLMANAGYYLFG